MRITERCDRCGAQAYVLTLHSGNPLFWCNHHFTKYEWLLAPHIFYDERELLNV